MNKKSLALLGATAACATALTACGGSGTSRSANVGSTGGQSNGTPVQLTVTTTIGGPETYHNIAISDYLDAVQAASDDGITYEFTYANGIVPPAEVGAAIGQGTVDLGLVVTSYTPTDYPVSNWLSQLAFAGVSGPPAMNLERSAAGLEWWWTHEEARQSDFIDQGLMPLTPAVNAHNAYQLICTSPITTLDEARGKSVRTPGEAWSDTARALGMDPVSLPGAEIYESLQRGIVDCVMADAPDMLTSQLIEVAHHYTAVNLPGFTPYGIFISKQTWDSMSPEQQQIMWDQLGVYIASLTSEGVHLQEELLETDGVEFHEASPDLATAIAEHQAQTLEEAIANPPASLSDAEEAVGDYVDLHEKWSNIVTQELSVPSADTWASWHADGGSADALDYDAYAERVVSEVLEQHRP